MAIGIRHVSSFAAAAMLVVSAAPAFSADIATVQPEVPIEHTWKFQLTTYGWASGLNGKVGVRDLPTVDVNVTFADILKNLDGALMGSFYATDGEWMFLTDLIWAKVSDQVTVGTAGGTVKYEQKQAIISGIAGYALPIDVPDLQLSATAGVRINHLKAKLDVNPADFPDISREGSKTWVDPIVGLSAHYDINERWFVNALADIGGFGVGSDITSQGFLALGYRWSEQVSTALGYRVLYTDYDKGGFVYNLTQHGPYAGLGFHF